MMIQVQFLKQFKYIYYFEFYFNIQNIITKITNYCIACLDPLNDDITYRGHAYKKILSVVSTVDNELHSETTYSKNPFIKPVRVSQIDYYSKLDNETNSKLKELCDRILNEQANSQYIKLDFI